MLSCKQVSKLISDSLERRLTFWEKLQLKFHIVMCKLCAGHKHDFEQLRQLIQSKTNEIEQTQADGLSIEARQRIQHLLNSLQ